MGKEQLKKRLQNQYRILHALHFEGLMRRGEIASTLGIRKSSITSIVSGLIDLGIVQETEPGHMRSPLRLDDHRFHSVVANLTPRDVRVARVYLSGKVEDIERLPVRADAGPDVILGELAATFHRVQKEASPSVLGFGVAMPGFIDPLTGTCLKVTNLKGWDGVCVSERLRSQLGADVYVDNDTRCQLFASTWFDRLAGETDDIIYLNIHDGVACAILTGGERVIGERFAAGEIGGIRAGNEGRSWPNGRGDCLEAYSSIPAMLSTLREQHTDFEFGDAGDIAYAARESDAVMATLNDMIGRIATVLAGFVAALDPHAVVLGTPSRAFSEVVEPLLKQHLFQELIGLEPAETGLVIAEEVETGTLKGVGAQVVDRAFRNAEVLQDTRVGA